MSLILEALKKSEQQRRLGEMPNLGTPITATRRRRSPIPWLAAVAVVAVAAVGGWRLLRQSPAPAPTAGESATIKATTKPEAATVPPPRQAVKPAAPSALPQQAMTPPPAPPPPAAVPAKKEATPPPPAAPAPPPPPLPVTARAGAQALAPVPPPAPVPAVPVAAPAPAAPAPAPTASDVPTVDDLPPNVRSALPQLPITMQVYSPDPKRRFVIIDGTRVVEGDSLRGVTVQEIRPNGLVLEFQGRRVLLPRPGS